jgi:asparaginyl-tRNA synthetase
MSACVGDIYTFGPTFRAEKSQTTKHLAEFHMVEPEMSFADIDAAMENAEGLLKHLASSVLAACSHDYEFLDKFVLAGIKERLANITQKPFARVSYTDAIKMLQVEISRNRSKWAYPDVSFGTDLQTEHERWLAEHAFKGCGGVFVFNYPRKIKSFYMRDNDDGITVASFDLLVPGIGELVGGSQREERTERLRNKLVEFGLKEEDYAWYMDLRRFGSVPHSGYGLGFERLVCYLTGVENIRDAVAFPRFPGSIDF